jgi:hypothetical protein
MLRIVSLSDVSAFGDVQPFVNPFALDKDSSSEAEESNRRDALDLAIDDV